MERVDLILVVAILLIVGIFAYGFIIGIMHGA